MKYYSIFVLLSLIGLPCLAKVISEDSALVVAQKFLKVNLSYRRSLVRWKGRSLSSDNDKNRSQEPYYIFTNSDSVGFVIVAGDDVARPILGYSTDTRLEDKNSLPHGMQDWLDDMERQIVSAQRANVSRNEKVAKQWASSYKGNVLKELNTALWGQNYPFNNQCPMDGNERSLSGCVPTAYAILMKYYGYPTNGKGKTKPYTTTKGLNVASRDLNHEYDWDNMPMEYINGKYSSTQASKVAYLMADIGSAIQVDYSSKATSGKMAMPQLFLNFDYFPGIQQYKDAYFDDDWYEILCTELDQDRPIIYRAVETKESGHAFILDGYTDNCYFHVNWGWNGNCNGYYALDAMVPHDGVDYTSQQSAFLSCIPMPMYEQANVAKVEDTECPSLAIAVALAEESYLSPVTITLLDDTQSDRIEISSGQDVSLELNGKKLDLSASFVIQGKLTVTDNAHGGCINQPYANNELFLNHGTLVIEGGTFTNEYNGADGEYYRRCIWSAEGSQTTISGGTFSTKNNPNLCLKGDATILGGEFTCKGNCEVISNYNTYGTLDIRGGTFTNSLGTVSGSDYRRAIWTTQGSNTKISSGFFYSNGNTLRFNGDATILDGDFISEGNSAVINNYNTSGTLDIQGGTFTNSLGSVPGSDYRRAIWTTQGSNMKISGGIFNSNGNTLCFNGDATILGGDFTCKGNSEVISNYNTYGTLDIQGGTFTNSLASVSGTDYRRAIWATQGSETIISGGTFTTGGVQTLCFNGDATINHAIINNTNSSGYGCLSYSGSVVTILGCWLKSKNLFYKSEDSSLLCRGGYFSSVVQDDFLAEDCECIRNTDNETKSKYPYMVVDNSEDALHLEEENTSYSNTFYDLSGRLIPHSNKGIYIVQGKGGHTKKIICR